MNILPSKSRLKNVQQIIIIIIDVVGRYLIDILQRSGEKFQSLFLQKFRHVLVCNISLLFRAWTYQQMTKKIW